MVQWGGWDGYAAGEGVPVHQHACMPLLLTRTTTTHRLAGWPTGGGRGRQDVPAGRRQGQAPGLT